MRSHKQIIAQCSQSSMPVALYNSKQVYSMEQAWFAQGYNSFGLMQQAAWQMTQHIIQLNEQVNAQLYHKQRYYSRATRQPSACIWVGQGNNGGDGWLIAHYLHQAGWQVQVMTVGIKMFNETKMLDKTQPDKSQNNNVSISDAAKAQHIALDNHCLCQRFEDSDYYQNEKSQLDMTLQADVYIDALFGIGLDRAPKGVYKQAICAFNNSAQQNNALAIAVDIPSGLVASTGQVFDRIAIQADVTLCLIARKFGLHTTDGMDYSGEVIDVPLIPYASVEPVATLLTKAKALAERRQNSYKGSYGHVLVIGGNRVDGSQGMGGAAILSSASAMAAGAGKITVACHDAFHGALLTSLPDAMTIDLHDQDGVEKLIGDATVVAIGMGLGRDKKAEKLFINYIQTIIATDCAIVIDADGLYHLASLQADKHELINELKKYSKTHQVCLTPHSGEAARLLNQEINEIESNRLSAIQQCADIYGGDWVLKGAGSLVLEKEKIYVCGVGNAGMATAGMGDVLSGVTAGLLAQEDLNNKQSNLHQAVLIHGLAGDVLVNQKTSNCAAGNFQGDNPLMISQRGMQSQDMPAAIRHVMQTYTY